MDLRILAQQTPEQPVKRTGWFETVGEIAMKLNALATIALVGGLVFASSSYSQPAQTGGPTPSPPGAKAEFLDLKDGAVIGPKTTIHFGLHGMGVAPAGTKKPNTGHFHLLIDRDLPPLDKPIPNDENDLHYGAGQTEVELTLPPGPHTLQLLLGDADHIPHTPPVYSDKIHVTAVESLPAPAAAAQAPAPGTRHPSPPGARVYLISPVNGAYVANRFRRSGSDLRRWASRRPGSTNRTRATTISWSTRRFRRWTSRSRSIKTVVRAALHDERSR